ncbi:hypothetical protein C10C_0796 [Chlamydia serpentis]|uniref:Uncharacterized protein n=1 Tax=Chlamydia serpentis TaxID=1967782 RepID=A0A2R8FBX2_9CHLA|nr:hypothetical protein [Chlamydia serpentis]SPN73939.1 hypothetical protein C10C_0796 [Chlamydia serpentis]
MTANTFGTLDILIKHSKEDDLSRFLPKDLLIKSPHPQDIPLKSLSFTLSWLPTVHPSWIATAMKDFPLEIQSQLLSWLPDLLVQEVLPLLSGIPVAKRRCAPFGAFYLLDMLSKKIRPLGITEEIFLPASSANAILYYTGPLKITLINCLGLYSIAKELKNVLDKVVIEKVKSVLNPTEKLFLAYCQSHPMKHLKTTNFLTSWSSDLELRQFIHKQGLEFLGKALTKENASFLWYFLRRLDVGRAYVIEQTLKEELEHPYVEYFKFRLEQCMKILIK